MNTAAAKAALKTLIEDNAVTLLTGLTAQGQNREIAHLTTTVLTPATAYFYIAIHQLECIERTRANAVNAARPERMSYHEMVIHIEDYAIGASGDDELFEVAQTNFDKLVDRIVALIEGESWLPITGGWRLVRNRAAEADRIITRSNALQQWSDEAANFHSMLYSQLRFTLEACIDNTELYQ